MNDKALGILISIAGLFGLAASFKKIDQTAGQNSAPQNTVYRPSVPNQLPQYDPFPTFDFFGGNNTSTPLMGDTTPTPNPSPNTGAPQVLGATFSASSAPYGELIKYYAAVNGIRPEILAGVIYNESRFNPNARNLGDPSYGLGAVLCRGSVSQGGNILWDNPCTNNFNISGWNGQVTARDLLDPKTNISFAAQILGWNIKTYGERKGVAVYNNWSARTAPSNGPFPNQQYVDNAYSYAEQVASLYNSGANFA